MNLRRGRIAILDDSRDILELFALILKGEHQIVTFSNPHEFLGKFESRDFDLILLDLVMPGMDGFEVFQEIRAKDDDVPVVAFTARAEVGEERRAMDAGFCDYFVKPILEIDRFREVVLKHVGKCANPPGQSSVSLFSSR